MDVQFCVQKPINKTQQCIALLLRAASYVDGRNRSGDLNFEPYGSHETHIAARLPGYSDVIPGRDTALEFATRAFAFNVSMAKAYSMAVSLRRSNRPLSPWWPAPIYVFNNRIR